MRRILLLLLGLILAASGSGLALACPFCTAPKPTLAERREAATVIAVAESDGLDGDQLVLRLDQILKGSDRLADPKRLVIPADRSGTQRGLLLVLGKAGGDGALAWETIGVDEVSLAYFVQSPSTRRPASERLAWFCRYLEYPDVLVADDAYAEFGRAPYDEVAKIADRLPMARLRSWLVDEDVPQERKGLYGLLAGLATSAVDRRANEQLLRSIIEQPASDFRAGFDGILGGYLLLAGEPGLQRIDELYFANPRAARGDVLHAMTALRFYVEYGRQIPRARLAQALAHLLATPSLAAPAIVDLARWQAWDELPQVVGLFGRDEYREPAVERAIIGYLLVCPKEQAAEKLAAIRRQAPGRVAEVEANLPLLGAGR